MTWDSISTNLLIEALFEKKQGIVTYDAEVAKLQVQMESLESASAQKDTCVAEYEAIVKKSEYEGTWWPSTVRNEIWQVYTQYMYIHVLVRAMYFPQHMLQAGCMPHACKV